MEESESVKGFSERDCRMKKENKKNTKGNLPYMKFSSNLPEFSEESIELAEKEKPIEIQVLKKGKFRHPWYGVLSFDDKFFDNIIKNFEAGVPQNEIAFDFKHNPDWGAAAWVRNFYKGDGGLMASVDLTEKGRQSVKGKEFRFFSIEYTDDYVEYEFSQEENGNGEPVEKESKISRGPTALGGGLTNRPFIKGMLPVSLSEDGEFVQLEEVDGNLKNDNNSEEVNIRMEKTLEELKKEQDELKEQITALSEKDDKKSKKALSDLNERLDGIESKITELSEDKTKEKENKKKEKEESVNLEEFENAKKELEEKEKKLSEKDKEVRKLSEDVSSLTKSVKSLMESNKVLQHDKHVANVEMKLEEFKSKGAFPAMIDVMKPALLSDAANGFTVTLSEDKDGEKVETKKSLADIFSDIIDSIPTENKVNLSEISETPVDSGGKELSLDEVEKYAKEKEITFDEALIHFSKEGKIE